MSNFHVTESGKTLVTLIPGDGIGPEVVDSTIRIIEATGAPIEWEERHAGERVFLEGQASGVRQDTIESIRKTRVVMKGPLGTPVGYGEKSANVTLRKLFETYGNIRPAREYPGVKTPYSGRGIDLVVVRENVEDLYAGIEYMLTPGVAQGLKLISRKGTEKIVRLAFELARAEGRESVVAMSKANIMKMTEGTLKSVFEEVSLEYDDIESWHVIVDNAAHQLVKLPEQYSVLVTTNMNGDILSDLSSALIGGLGFAPSANIGNEVFIAEAVHGSAPKYAGKDVINPTAMILSGVMMLRHLDMFEEAALIENAVITTLEEGKVMTRDVVGDERQGGTTGYTNEIIKNLGKKPTDWKIREYKPIKLPQLGAAPDFVKVKTRQVCGVDIFIESASDKISIGQSMERICEGRDLYLKMVDSRGTMLYPPNDVMTDTVDAWRARFMLRDDAAELNDAQLIDLLQAVAAEHMWAHVEKLQRFEGGLRAALARFLARGDVPGAVSGRRDLAALLALTLDKRSKGLAHSALHFFAGLSQSHHTVNVGEPRPPRAVLGGLVDDDILGHRRSSIPVWRRIDANVPVEIVSESFPETTTWRRRSGALQVS